MSLPVAEQLKAVEVVTELFGAMVTPVTTGARLVIGRSKALVAEPPLGSVTVASQRMVSVELAEAALRLRVWEVPSDAP